mmetsp:Transcript_6650/g.11843  ORF Transcript_6650/g.11843 Transcript_6650/m.11843 type:complete len:1765 (-) Transcript_6650:235-5529(-)|eukprot:CAMPEP_0201992588 /NCGR_PEP_ID=MMETSP0905-20130828/1106_1 /ASSEMBLY_ACC=CAM_ASM_000554 /TAXON_ID=420261 /ORGANISM="Thalassiosira antarctica, Strain CCMP982" /LENGTH=1764 /DNA_ID=CAMNT_0048547281 /DNA_START=21 /DNA_END=5315 /DNA_ORIENTATION=-
MAESNQEEDDNNGAQRRRLTIFHHYFLWRLGLISDEVDWPHPSNNNSPLEKPNEEDASGDCGASWRARDALTAILGSDASIVMSDSGLTMAEISLLAGQQDEGGSLNHWRTDRATSSASSSLVVPIASIVPPLFWNSDDGDSNNDQPPLLNIDNVRRAFDAAAFAIVRGHQRASLAAAASTVDDGNGIETQGGSERDDNYDPPLLLAMEAIRTARISTLEEASSSESVPPFLKKNNTIPWFHVPVQQATRGGVSTAAVTALTSSPTVSSVVGCSTVPGTTGGGSTVIGKIDAGRKVDVKAKKKEHGKTNTKKRSHLPDDVSSSGITVGNEALKNKRTKLEKSDAASPAVKDKDPAAVARGGKKEKKDTNSKSKASGAAKKSTQPKRTSSSSSTKSKHLLLSPTNKPKKIARVSSSSVIEDASSLGSGNNATVSRAIISAAAAAVFQEFHPEYDDGNDAVTKDDNAAELDMSIITSGNTLLNSPTKETKEPQNNAGSTKPSPTIKKNIKEEDTKVNMDQVVAQAKRLGNRVLDHTNGAARRGDQRREFRMDGALSRVDDGRGAVFQDGHYGGGEGLGEGAATRKRNSFLVRPAHALPLVIPNPFVRMNSGSDSVDDDESAVAEIIKGDLKEIDDNNTQLYNNGLAQGPMIAPWKTSENGDAEWTESCLPRLLAILRKGAGHAIVHDMQWSDRSFRVANMLQNMAISPCLSKGQSSSASLSTTQHDHGNRNNNYGPHLIVTSSGEDFDEFARVFGGLGHGLMHSVVNMGDGSGCAFPTTHPEDVLLRVLPYHGSKARRRQLRKHFGSLVSSPESHFSFLGGLRDSPFHVILTTYSELVEDYAHFCQIPFQVVVLDDGMSWLGCANSDPHGKIGKVWNSGLWSNFDHGAGRAGVAADGGQKVSTWDFSKDVGVETDGKPGSSSGSTGGGRNRIGLTARHRILLASNMHAKYRGQVYKAPVLGLLSFLAPQFAETIRDGWERSKVFSCKNSMAYIRTMVARLVVVYSGDPTICGPNNDLINLSLKSLDGELPLRSLKNHTAQEDEGVDKLIKSQKIVQSRKYAAAWFQPSSPIRKELGKIALDSILAAVKKVNAVGFTCEEIVTASSLTTSGAGGCVVGLSAYRPAVRCGRCFSSEQGLKLHINALHAPPATWLCRSCGEDCGTSQARSHHERTCGKPKKGSIQSSLGGAAPTVGQGTTSSRGRKKKEVKKPAITEIQSVEDVDGSTRVPGYKGVWAQKTNGKYLVKVDGKPLVDNNSEKETPILFATAEAAAKKFDEIITERGKVQELEMNYKSDGSRIVHKGGAAVGVSATKSAEISGSGAIDATTPDLSVIDIKDLPPHVKPLLRDPNQTSRTGGNSKRYVYAYRGVCRQQRKGHDRWQAQISFNGTNHYLGTFDSEWDAAAVYSWAHLILYGEEATKKAQLEGEEAAAAFAQHEKDIAEGKIPPPSPSKPAKKKKRGALKKNLQKGEKSGKTLGSKLKGDSKAEILPETKGNVLVAEMPASAYSKKKRPISLQEWSKLKTECAMMLSSGTKGTSKATILATRKDIADMSEKLLLHNISDYISGHLSSVSKTFLQSSQTPDRFQQLPACVSSTRFVPPMLIGLQASDVAWEIEKFIEACQDASALEAVASYSKLFNEFGAAGANRLFRTFLLSPSCTIGRASKGTQNTFLPSDHVNSTLGMPVGNLECNIGGPDYSCSEMAAKIQFLPSKYGNFQFMACNDDDIVTLNGQRITESRGALPLRDRDVCSVGARVFVFFYQPDSWDS